MRRLRDERGGVLVMAAVMIPVFLLLTALVVDVGNWYTHKRQLQNRADAGAFAAGVEYAKNWKACVQTRRRRPARVDGGRDRRRGAPVRGRPRGVRLRTGDACRRRSGTPRSRTRRSLDVVINSNDPNYTDDTDYTDGGGSPPLGNPCSLHTTGDDISAPGHWTDVRVKERDLPSLFGSVGLPLSRNGARARVEIRPAISGHRFLPLAVPNNVITKVQVRYYNECTTSHRRCSRRATSRRSPPPTRAGSRPGRRHALGPAERRRSERRRPRPSLRLTLPSLRRLRPGVPAGRGRGADREPQRDRPRTNSCAQLLAMQYADCFHAALADPRLERRQRRQPGPDRRRPPDRRLRQRPSRRVLRHAARSRRPTAATAPRLRQLGRPDETGTTNVPANFTVSGERRRRDLQGSLGGQAGGYEPLLGAANALTANPGANDVTVAVSWTDTDASHTYQGGQPVPERRPEPLQVQRHRARPPDVRRHAGNGRRRRARPHVGRRRGTPSPNLPGNPYATRRRPAGNSDHRSSRPSGSAPCCKTGVYTTLRLDDPQANQTLQCDPNYAQGQEFSALPLRLRALVRREPLQRRHADTRTTRPRGGTRRRSVPAGRPVVLVHRPGRGLRRQLEQQPVALRADRAGHVHRSGRRLHRRGDRQLRQLQQQLVPDLRLQLRRQLRRQDAARPTAGMHAREPGDSQYPRVVNLFIVPYQASKGLTRRGRRDPRARLRVLLRHGLDRQQLQSERPLPGHDLRPRPERLDAADRPPHAPAGAITGVFVETVDYEPGPVDPTAICVEGQLTPCRVALVR